MMIRSENGEQLQVFLCPEDANSDDRRDSIGSLTGLEPSLPPSADDDAVNQGASFIAARPWATLSKSYQ
jgi:hypothetical protein